MIKDPSNANEILLKRILMLEEKFKLFEIEFSKQKKALKEHNVSLVHLKKKGKKLT